MSEEKFCQYANDKNNMCKDTVDAWLITYQ